MLAQRTDGVTPIPFHDWWISQGKFIDPDTEDVPWYDKREALCEAAYDAGQSSVRFAEAYVAHRTEPALAQPVPQSTLLRAAKWNRITWPCDRSDFLAWRPQEDGVGIEVLIYNYANRQLPSGDGLFYVADAPSLRAIGGNESEAQAIQAQEQRRKA